MDSQDQSSDRQAPAQDQSFIGQALAKFTIFPQLVPDIRIMIWKATLTPRLLSRQCLSVNSTLPPSSMTVPSLLSVNAEARCEVVKCYKNIAISAERLQDLRLSRRSWVPKEKKLQILFNPEIDMIVDENLRCDLYPLSHSNDVNADKPSRSPLLVDPDFVKKVQVSTDVFMNSFWTWDQTLWDWQDNYYGFEDIKFNRYQGNDIRFADLRFNNLNEFIVQDVNCALPHQLDSPETRAIWKEILGTIFEAEQRGKSSAHIRFSIPKMVIRPGAKVGLCDHCIARFTPWTKWPLEAPLLPVAYL
ncbi:uncharacterized protein EAF01_006275 [Botrytis porri]|nr:uncharacterized protein EAF01_006275 [Botrytis porri]KAF7903226.1 hypothetical protein EAF01_006275 [Botrytis porri]